MYTQPRLDKTTSPPPMHSSNHISDEIKYRMIEKFNAMSKNEQNKIALWALQKTPKEDGMKQQMRKYGELVFQWTKETMSPCGEDKVLLVNKNSVHKWVTKKDYIEGKYGDTKTKKVITQERFCKWINYLLDNLYVQVGDKLMKQVIGIPMGVSCAPYLANLMLFMYEFEYFKKFIKQHDPLRYQPARDLLQYLSCCTRYIDNL